MSDETISFNDWLQGFPTINEDNKYRHRRLDEETVLRDKILPHLEQIVHDAHEDARRRLREIEGVSLDPLEIPTGQDPAEGYPERLHMNTLMGYFGEIFAGVICENFAPLGEARWKVPAYLFRFHLDEFRHLDQIHQIGVAEDLDEEKRVGRTGDDCLAFVLDENGKIVRSMFCEAKCLNEHDNRKIEEAHKKLSDPLITPLDRQQLIDVLQDSDHPEATVWVEALRRLRFRLNDPDYERCDLVCYVCGEPPVKSDVRIPKESSHPAYKGGRPLEAIEVYIHEVRQLVKEVYEKDDDESDE